MGKKDNINDDTVEKEGEQLKSKKKKKKKSKADEKAEEPIGTNDDSKPVDVAAVLKSKAKVQKKTIAEIASSKAAKEAKAKKQASRDKKKKKKKDKYAHGAPTR